MKQRRGASYFLLGPGLLWLLVFFAIPMVFMAYISLNSGSLSEGFQFTWEWSNFSDAITEYKTQFGRTFLYAGVATVLALLIAYPLAYAIAFKGGRWKTALLFIVIAPFFTTYLIRTLAWQTILADEGQFVDLLKTIGIIGEDSRGPRHRGLGDRRAHLQLPAVHDPADLRQPRGHRRAAGRGGQGPLRVVANRVLAGDVAALGPGVIAGTLLTFIPAAGDYINADFLGGAGQQMIGNVIQNLYIDLRLYPAAAALSFVMMAVILVIVLIYIRFAGSEALMGDEGEQT